MSLDQDVRTLERAASLGDAAAQERLDALLSRIPGTPPAVEAVRAERRREFAERVNVLAHAANGRASARIVGGARIAVLVRVLADQKVGARGRMSGGTVSKAYLRDNSASTTVVLVRRVRGGVCVSASRETISKFDPDETYATERRMDAVIPISLARA